MNAAEIITVQDYKQKRYNENKKTKAARYSARILEIYVFCWKIQQRASGPGENAAGVMVEGKAQLEHSSHIVKVDVEAYTSQRLHCNTYSDVK